MTDLLMPPRHYGDDRAFAFDMLAQHAGVRPLELRVALSNVFVSLARQGRIRSAVAS